MKILLVGGGSGGHITPLLAVAKSLKIEQPTVKIHIVTENSGKFGELFKDLSSYANLHKIWAGKLRRYHNESWFDRLRDVPTILLNIRDVFLMLVGFIQALLILARLRPNAVFIKGGFVGVPVGMACRLLRVAYITHDSDASAGLTNRLIGSGAHYNAVGMPPEMYKYNKNKIVYVGVPIGSEYSTNNSGEVELSRKDIGVKNNEKLLLILGGSLGAQRLDKIMHESLETLLEDDKSIVVIHQVGVGNENIYDDYPEHLKLRISSSRFLHPLAPFSKAADLVVTRAGATAISELAALSKPIIVVPHPQLTGGHQLDNAAALDTKEAALVIDESTAMKQPSIMTDAVKKLFENPEKRSKLGKNLHDLLPHDATSKISELLIKVANKKN